VARRANLTAPDQRDEGLPVDFLLAAFLEAFAFVPVDFLLAAFLEAFAFVAPALAAVFFGAAFSATAFVRTARSGRMAAGA
jgi:hypothetical protein